MTENTVQTLELSGALGSLPNSRTVALTAGDLSVAVRDEVKSVLREKKGKQLEALKVGIQRLADAGHVSRDEARSIQKLAELVLRASSKKDSANPMNAAAEVRRIHRGILGQPAASPAALAIAGLANSAFTPEEGPGDGGTVMLKATITPGNAATGAVVGGVIGGIVGGVVGGGIGAGIGAAIGGAAGAAIGACNDEGV